VAFPLAEIVACCLIVLHAHDEELRVGVCTLTCQLIA
jgi:hypothetical protein